MAAFLISLAVVVMLIVGGVIVNLYLYSRGAIGDRFRSSRHLSSMTVKPGVVTEDHFGMSIGVTDNVMNNYVRRSIIIISFGIIVILSILLAVIINGIR